MMQACSSMTVQLNRLNVTDLETEGWGWLAEGLKSHPGIGKWEEEGPEGSLGCIEVSWFVRVTDGSRWVI